MPSINYIIGQQDITDPNGWVDSLGNVPPTQFQNVPQNTNYPLNGDGRYWWTIDAALPGAGAINFIGNLNYLSEGSVALTWQVTQVATDGSVPTISYSTNGGGSYTVVPLGNALQSGSVTVALPNATSAVTVTSASPGVVTWTGFPGQNGDVVVLAGTTAPTGLAFATAYYVVGATANTFELSLTRGGTPIITSSTGTAVTATLSPGGLTISIGSQAASATLQSLLPVTTISGYAAFGFSDGTVPIKPDVATIPAFGTFVNAALPSGYQLNALVFAYTGVSTTEVQLSITGLTAAPAQNLVTSLAYTGASGVRNLLGSAATYSVSGDTATWIWSVTGTGDPYFASVGLLAQMTAGNGVTAFTDSSLNLTALATTGTAQQTNASYEFAPSSGEFLAATDEISCAVSPAGLLDLSNNNGVFTIEGWFNVATQTGLANYLMGSYAGGNAGWYLKTGTGAGPWPLTFSFWNGSSFTSINSTQSIVAGTWYNFAVVRSAGTITLYVNGAVAGSAAYASTTGYVNKLELGSIASFSGATTTRYLQSVRITKNVARYTSAYAAPVALYPAYFNTDFEPYTAQPVSLTTLTLTPYQVAVAITRNVNEGPVFDYPNPMDPINYNCQALDFSGVPSATLAQLQVRMLLRTGFAAQASNPGASTAAMVNDFLTGAQTYLYRRYPALHTRRFFRWKMVPGQRFYSLKDNDENVLGNYHMDPLKPVEWAGIQDSRNVWYSLIEGIEPQLYTMVEKPWRPARYSIRQALEVYPAPDQTYWLWIRANFGLLSFVNPTDTTTLDSELVFLWALATMKAHYGQPDANNVAAMANAYRGELIAGTHGTQQYIPGVRAVPPAIRPTLIQYGQ